jgi:hypothetical protein
VPDTPAQSIMNTLPCEDYAVALPCTGASQSGPVDSCPCLPGTDDVTNFLDGSPDDCMLRFTPCQARRMHAAFWRYRAPASAAALRAMVHRVRLVRLLGALARRDVGLVTLSICLLAEPLCLVTACLHASNLTQVLQGTPWDRCSPATQADWQQAWTGSRAGANLLQTYRRKQRCRLVCRCLLESRCGWWLHLQCWPSSEQFGHEGECMDT